MAHITQTTKELPAMKVPNATLALMMAQPEVSCEACIEELFHVNILVKQSIVGENHLPRELDHGKEDGLNYSVPQAIPTSLDNKDYKRSLNNAPANLQSLADT